jgi:nicotinate-nucleotide adenylyltransferase
MRIGIFGGSFDPIHYGHLILAEQCREQAKLQEIVFVPAAKAPHKPDGAEASDRQRVEMLQLAIAGHFAFTVSQIELERGGKSYTIETLENLKSLEPESELFLLIGADSLENFAAWKQPEQICKLAVPLVFSRPTPAGTQFANIDVLRQYVDEVRFNAIRDHQIQGRLIDISSTDIRWRVKSGKTIRYLTPRAVEQYIMAQKLYI